jgi:hypothetical protein
MTVWIVWVLAIGLIFGLGLASSRISREEKTAEDTNKVKAVLKKENTSAINDSMNEAKAGSSTNVSAVSLSLGTSGVGTLSSRQQRAAASEI